MPVINFECVANHEQVTVQKFDCVENSMLRISAAQLRHVLTNLGVSGLRQIEVANTVLRIPEIGEFQASLLKLQSMRPFGRMDADKSACTHLS